MKDDGEGRCYLFLQAMASRSGLRGTGQSQLAARKLFPRERLMFGSVGNGRAMSHKLWCYAPRIQEGQINYIRHLYRDACFVYYFCCYIQFTYS